MNRAELRYQASRLNLGKGGRGSGNVNTAWVRIKGLHYFVSSQ